MKTNDPNEWANKRKVAMERAKQIRDERKNGNIDADDSTFTPQINKRPLYLNNKSDSLDRLTNEVQKINTNDIMELPLPGNNGKNSFYEELQLPSPGSDALGKEIKKFNSGNDTSQPNAHRTNSSKNLGNDGYKSKFLQQYESRIDNAPVQENKKNADPDDAFMNTLRSGDNKRSGPGWNDDTTTNGFEMGRKFSPPAKNTSQNAPTRRNSNTKQKISEEVLTHEDFHHYSERRHSRQLRSVPQQDWNNDVDVDDPVKSNKVLPVATRPPGGVHNTSPRSINTTHTDKTSMEANQAQAKLSLLKSKIRRSIGGQNSAGPSTNGSNANEQSFQVSKARSGSGSSTMDKKNSIYDMSSEQDEYSGPRSAPLHGFDSHSSSKRGNYNSRNDDNDSIGNDSTMTSNSGQRGAGNSINRRSKIPNTNLMKEATSHGNSYLDDHGYSGHKNEMQPRKHSDSMLRPFRMADADLRSHSTDEDYGNEHGIGILSRHNSQPNNRSQSNIHEDHFRNRGFSNDADYMDRGGPSPRYDSNAKINKISANNSQFSNPPTKAVPPRQQPTKSTNRGNDYYDEDGQDSRGGLKSNDLNQTRVPKSLMESNFDEYGEIDPFDPNQGMNQPQLECPDCGRKFISGPYEKHIKICAKVFMKKRKAFDSKKMRIMDNPELVQILNKVEKEEAKSKKGKPTNQAMKENQSVVDRSKMSQLNVSEADKKSKWKEQSNAFRDAMKAARVYQNAVTTGAPLPPPVISAPDSSLIPCPHCGRRFSEKAGERHIPQCQNIKAKPSSLKKGGGGGGGINGAPVANKKAASSNKGKKF